MASRDFFLNKITPLRSRAKDRFVVPRSPSASPYSPLAPPLLPPCSLFAPYCSHSSHHLYIQTPYALTSSNQFPSSADKDALPAY